MPRRRASLAALAASLTLLALPAAAPAALTWGDPVDVSVDGAIDHQSVTTTPGGAVTVAWTRCLDDRCVVEARTRGASGTWGAVQEVSETAVGEYAFDVEVAAGPGGAVAAVWTETDGGGDRVVSGYRAAGETAWTKRTLSAPADEYHTIWPGSVAVAGDGEATAVWDRSAGFDHVVEAAHFDAGAAQAKRELAREPDPWVGEAQVAADAAGVATVVFTDDIGAGACAQEVVMRRQTATAWTAPVRLNSTCADFEYADAPKLAATADGGLLAVWHVSAGDVNGRDVVEGAVIDAAGDPGAPFLVSDEQASHTNGIGADTWELVSDPATGDAAVAYSTYESDPDGPYDPEHRAMVVTRNGSTGPWSAPHLLSGPHSGSGYDPQIALALTPAGELLAAHTVQALADGGLGYEAELSLSTRSADGTWSTAAPLHTVDGGIDIPDGLDLMAGPGGAVLAWTRTGDGGQVEAMAATDGTVDEAPVASFSYAPAAPKAGEVVKFTSTSTDPEGQPLELEWDLDDDGAFDDGTTASVTRAFATAGTYTVELRVTDAGGTTRVATRDVVVTAAASGTPTPDTGTGTATPTPTPGGGAGTPPPATGGGAPPVALPADFVPTALVPTQAERRMPDVVSRPLDQADAKVERGLVHVRIDHERVVSPEKELPGGRKGKWEVGDVVAQSVKAGTALTTSIGAPAEVTLRFWAGDRNDRRRCDELRGTLKGDALQTALEQLKAAGCGKHDIVYKPSAKADDVEVKKVTKGDDVVVKVPTRLEDVDLRLWKSHGPLGTGSPGPAEGDYTLTAGQPNAAGVVVVDRADRRMPGARVTFDLAGTGGRDVTVPSNGDGIAAAGLRPEKAGKVRVVVEWRDANRDPIYGYTEFKVVDRCDDASFRTIIGETFKRGKGSCRFERTATAAGAPRATAAGIAEWFGLLADAVRGFGGAVAGGVQNARTAAEGLVTSARMHGVTMWQLWTGGSASGAPQLAGSTKVTSGMWLITGNGVVAAGGANVVSAGGANVVSAGGANVVAAGGMNLIAGAGGRILSDMGLGVVSAGGGNLMTLPDGARVVSAGGANVIAAGGGNVISAGGGN